MLFNTLLTVICLVKIEKWSFIAEKFNAAKNKPEKYVFTFK